MGEYFVYSAYAEIEDAILTTANTTYDVRTKSGTKLVYADEMTIKSDQTVTIQFNGSANDVITVTAAETPKRFNQLRIETVKVTNPGGSTANIKMLFLGKAQA